MCHGDTDLSANPSANQDNEARFRSDSNRSVAASGPARGHRPLLSPNLITPSRTQHNTSQNVEPHVSDFASPPSGFNPVFNRSMYPELAPSSTPSSKLCQVETSKPHTNSRHASASVATPNESRERSPQAPISCPALDIVTIDSDSDSEISGAEDGTVDGNPSVPSRAKLSPPPKRPRHAVPEVIDVDDDETLSQLQKFAAERVAEVCPKMTKYAPILPNAAKASHVDKSKANKLQVSRGGGLFVVSKEGTVEIVDSDDEAIMSNTQCIVTSDSGLERLETWEGGKINQPDNAAGTMISEDEQGSAVEKEALIHDVDGREKGPKRNIVAPRNGADSLPRDRDFPTIDLTEIHENEELPYSIRENGGSQKRSGLPVNQDSPGYALQHGPAIGNRGGSAANAKGLAQRLGLTGNDTDADLIFDPTCPIRNLQTSSFGLQHDATLTQNEDVIMTESPTRMQLLDGDNVRPQFVAISSPGSVQPTPQPGPSTVSLNLRAKNAASCSEHACNDVAAEGLTSQELNNLVKQNLLTADATEESESPEELSVALLPHQKRALAWMTKRESPPDIDDDVVAVEDQCLGGILADEQGLGKTLSMIALILKSASASRDTLRKDVSAHFARGFGDNHELDHAHRESKGPPWRTLIVCPLSVINQWKEEFVAKIKREYLPSIYVYHGPKRDRRVRRLKAYDVVLTTYPTLTVEYPKILKQHPDYEMRKAEKLDLPRRPSGPLCKIKWNRVVLDESQHIKNRGTECWSAVMSLAAEKRWCLTGTPIQNCVDDLYSLFLFIRYNFVPNYEVWNREWKKKLEHPLPKVREKYFRRFQAIAGVVLLRRTKRDRINGRNLINLPPRRTKVNDVHFADAEELQVYQAVAAKTVVEMNKFIVNGTFIANYTNVLMLFLRLRQACCHPFLIEYTRMRRGGTAEELHPDFATSYTLEELEEAMDVRTSGYCMVDMLPERIREHFIKYLGPLKRGTPVPSMFQCSYCLVPSTWANGWTLPCGEIICSKCRDMVVQSPECRRCGYKFIGRDVAESIFNADNIRKEIHAMTILGGSSKGNSTVTTAEFRHLLNEELQKRTGQRISEAGKVKVTRVSDKTRVQDGSPAGSTDDVAKRKLVAAFSQYSTKIRMIVEELKQVRQRGEGEKTLIFSQWNSMLDIIEFHVKVEGFETCRLDGTMSLAVRQQQIREFQQNKQKVAFLISLHAGGTGINLTAASRVILTDVWWNPAVEEQAIDRVHRIGQKRPVHITRFKMLGTVEEHIYKLCQKKREAVNGALGEAGKQNYGRTKLSRQEILALFGATAKDVIRSSGAGTVAAEAANNLLSFSGM
eukprot:GFKZ01011742.1.p1 GENE.GFKZ01011742.1~~GFKZ01011742.1.p1  ORF type:complete len:1441 (+),score=203.29 GFKZ01011742.1:352-4323(+)